MGFQPMIWAAKSAPIGDVEEWAVLVAMAESADEDGCNAYQSTKTIARRTRLSERTVQRRIDQLEERGLIVRGDQRNISHKIPSGKRPVLYDVMVPAEHWGVPAMAELNVDRETKGLPPITPHNRPPHGPAPEKKRRKDLGVPKVTADQDETETPDGAHGGEAGTGWGDYKSGVTTSHRVTRSPAVGRQEVTQPNPVTHPSPLTTFVEGTAGAAAAPDGPTEALFAASSVEVRPEPDPPKPKVSTKGTPAPETFEITPKLRAWAANSETGAPDIDLERETQNFLDYHAAKGSLWKMWDRAWMKWMRTQQQFHERDRSRQGSRPGPSNRIVDSSIDSAAEAARAFGYDR